MIIIRSLAEMRAKRSKERKFKREALIESQKDKSFNLTDEEIEQCKEEDGYNDFIKPLSELALARTLEDN